MLAERGRYRTTTQKDIWDERDIYCKTFQVTVQWPVYLITLNIVLDVNHHPASSTLRYVVSKNNSIQVHVEQQMVS